jgi:serine/threonine-protein kinase
MYDLSDSSTAPIAFGPFRVLHQIGVGVLGPVYRAQDSVREQLVAVKAFKVDAPPELAADIANALQELAHALPRHRGLLEYIASGVERTTPYLVMTHSDVPSLDTKLKPGVPLDAEEALDLIATLADAIDAAHAKGIIHGTLHPRDVFVDDRGGCRVSGFGIATVLAGAGIRAVPVRRPYSPPERVVGGPIERSADLFALGALAFELFSGRRVVGTGLDAAVRCAVSAPDVDVERLRTALAAMLSENPGRRPSSATAFAQAVTQAVRPRGLTAAAIRKRVTPAEIGKIAGAAGRAAAASAAIGNERVPALGGSGAQGGSTAAGAQAGAGAGVASARAPEPSGSAPSEPAAAESGHITPSTSEPAHDGPTPDALEIFTRQGTLWEANRRSETDAMPLETVTVSPDEDPLALFSSEASAKDSSAALGANEKASEAETQKLAVPRGAIADSPDADTEPLSAGPLSLGPLSAGDVAAASGQAADVRIDDEATEGIVAHAAAEPLVVHNDPPVAQNVASPEHEFEYLRSVPAQAVSAESHVAQVGAAASLQTAAAFSSFRDAAVEDPGHVLTGLRGWTPAEEPVESSTNPLRVLVMVLAVGLAVGIAGGYLLGQHTALRQAIALLRGEPVLPASEQASSPKATPGATSSAASGSTGSTSAPSGGGQSTAASAGTPTEISEPTPIPEGSAARKTPPSESTHGARASQPLASTQSAQAAQPTGRASAIAARDSDRAGRSESARATAGRLLVESSPARAEVIINGIRRGETPVTVHDLPFGTHTIRVSRGGYLTSTRKVRLSASRASEALEFDLQPESRSSGTSAAGAGVVAAGGEAEFERASAEATAAGLGALLVLSHPTGARVLVDGQYVGMAPLLVTNVAPGTRTVKLELPGHKTWSSSVQVMAGQRVRVAASLEEGTN